MNTVTDKLQIKYEQCVAVKIPNYYVFSKEDNNMNKQFKKLAVLVSVLALVLSAIPVSAKAQTHPRLYLYKQVRIEDMSVTLGWFQPSMDKVKFFPGQENWHCKSCIKKIPTVTLVTNLSQRKPEKTVVNHKSIEAEALL